MSWLNRLPPSVVRATPSRAQSTSAVPASYRTVASALLSRPPLILPELTPLEATYYSYQRRIHRALAKPLDTSTDWFFKKGSASEKAFIEFDAKVEKEIGTESEESALELIREEGSEEELVERRTRADIAGDTRSLERELDKTLYLLVKKDRKENDWQFPQGGVEAGESLLAAAKRELTEETGPNMDVWPAGRVPAGHYAYSFPKSYKKTPHAGANVYFLPMRIIRGQAKPNKEEGLVDYAWLTKEEIKGKVSEDYWKAVEPMLS